MRKAGLVLAIAGWAVFLYGSLATPLFARSHPHHDVPADYTAAWPTALAAALGLAGIVLVLIPIRRRESWAWWTSMAVLALLFGVRMASDPRCLVVLDAHQHGCHTFMIAMVLAAVGLGLLHPRAAPGDVR